jgi:MFS family permease
MGIQIGTTFHSDFRNYCRLRPMQNENHTNIQSSSVGIWVKTIIQMIESILSRWTCINNKAMDGFHHVQFIAAYLFLFAGYGVLIPFLPVYFDSLGLSAVTIGILGMIPNIASFTCAPLWSLLSDAYNIKSEVLIGTMIGSIVFTLLFLVNVGYTQVAMYVYIIVSVGAIFRAPMSPLMDAIVMQHLKDNSDYGKMRLWGAVGFGIFSFIGGALSSSRSGECPHGSCFHRIFYVYGGLGIVVILVFFTMKQSMVISDQKRNRPDRVESSSENGNAKTIELSKMEEKGDDIVEIDLQSTTTTTAEEDDENSSAKATNGIDGEQASSLELLAYVFKSQPSVLIFALVIFLSGMGSGVIDTFLFIRLKELGASGFIMGTARFITCAAEVPMFQIASTLQAKFGIWKLVRFTVGIFNA